MLLPALTVLASLLAAAPVFAGRHDPAPASPGSRPECLAILLENDFHVPNAQLFLKSVAEAPGKVQVELPYKMTTGYEVKLVRFDAVKLPGVAQVYLSWADRVQVIPVMAHLESWHNLIRHLDGFHFTLSFETPEARAAFIESVGHKVHVPAGKFTARKKTHHIAVVTPEQLTAALHALNSAKARAQPAAEPSYEPSSKSELEQLSDTRSEPTASGTRYFFKGTEPVGFVRNGKYFRYTKPPVSPLVSAAASFASHHNILRRQRGLRESAPTIPIDPQAQFRLGRENLDADLAELERNTTLPQSESARLKAQAETRAASLLIALDTVNYPWPSSLPVLLSSVATARLELLEAQVKHLSGETKLRVADLPQVTNDVNSLKTFKPNGARFVRFVWLRKSTIHPSSYLRNSEFVFVDGAVLHDQLALAAFGRELGARPDFIEEHLRGGLAEIRYDAEGRAAGVEIVDAKMTVPAGRFEMSAAESAKLSSELLTALSK